MNKLLAGMKNEGQTWNGALKYNSTLNAVYDLFARGGAMRQASEEDIIELFKAAYEEDALMAMRCLFYERDIISGQGERRFFRVCLKWLGDNYPETAIANLDNIATTGIGRFDDIYALVDTKAQDAALKYLVKRLHDDYVITLAYSERTSISLAGKWAKSINASSKETRRLGLLTAQAGGWTERQYRKLLSVLRARINIVERLISANRWDEIDFSKLPARAGLQYAQAFENHCGERYRAFMESKNTTVNAGALYPYDVVKKARRIYDEDSTQRNVVNKYWDNLTDYFNGMSLNALAVVDTSGSMTWGGGMVDPIDVAISLGLYCAERAHGPFANHFITFSREARLIECTGRDFVEKVQDIYDQDLCENTNLDSVFKLVLDTACKYHLTQADMPEHLVIISDMQCDDCCYSDGAPEHIMAVWRAKFSAAGYVMPKLIWWNVNALNPTMLDEPEAPGVTYVSGCSPVLFEMVLSGKTGMDMMWDKLTSDRYSAIVVA